MSGVTNPTKSTGLKPATTNSNLKAAAAKIAVPCAQARRKNKRRHDYDEECGLKLDDEVRLANEG